MTYYTTVFLTTGACAFTLFLARFYTARQAIWKLQKANVPMPEFKLIAGHFMALKECIQALPRNTTFHTVMLQLSKKFPTGIFYIDLWPFNQTLMIVATPFGASQVEGFDLPKPLNICDPLDTLTGGPSLLTMRGADWKRWRSLFNPGFSAGYMMGLAPAIADEVAVFCELLRKHASQQKPFPLEELTLRLTFDVIGAVTLDTRLHYQTADNPLASALRTQIEWTSFGTSLNPFKRYLSVRPIVQWYNSRRMDRYIYAEIDKRFVEHNDAQFCGKDQKRSKSIISLVLSQYLDEEKTKGEASKKAFRDIATPQLRLFLFAGHDTTSSTLLYCYHLLATHPEVLSRVRAEHDQVFGTDASQIHQVITQNPQLLNQIPYTFAVIKEVLRLFPPSASLRQGRSGIDIVDEDGRRYPTEGCNVWSLVLALHHNPKYWKEPETFIPERWLVGSEDPLYPVKGAWRAFEFGARSCIGQTLALLELRIALAMTIREFSITPAYDEWDDLHPRIGVKTVNGNRAYQAEKGGGGAHPADGYPCRVALHGKAGQQ
ncbi:AflN/verA/monooxygenase [Glonium stellatum]|uniref:AflN/verA/monooxygenase n=1 Tax=Glonium stellatum TaxID=574774 RepID=A0A8E2JSX0_9PEZI|nr:AflN/verA/monooxygenase [Glonium stellatum]